MDGLHKSIMYAIQPNQKTLLRLKRSYERTKRLFSVEAPGRLSHQGRPVLECQPERSVAKMLSELKKESIVANKFRLKAMQTLLGEGNRSASAGSTVPLALQESPPGSRRQ
eukprot:scaffold526875_cov50-Prasinocladus_malaysianus.AAC.1